MIDRGKRERDGGLSVIWWEEEGGKGWKEGELTSLRSELFR